MKVCDYVVDYLARKGVTDVYGIPGGVVLDLLYAFKRDCRITPHLSFHEQGAAFEACGYSQVEHKLGVAYATRGPGFTNLITGIADAYADSIPVLFLTAHSGTSVGHEQRFEKDQEMDTVSMVKHITKYAKAIDNVEEVKEALDIAVYTALNGRKGPVLLDFSAALWNKENQGVYVETKKPASICDASVCEIKEALEKAQRPIFLVGDGVRQAGAVKQFEALCAKINIPVLSSRCGQDVGAVAKHYYGYVGSHGVRYGNFIFAKADLVIALGNRLSFPVNSKSFSKALENKKIFRVELDDREIKREIKNTYSVLCEISDFLRALDSAVIKKRDFSDWICVCDKLKSELMSEDLNEAIQRITKIFRNISETTTICCDVGNNEFWVSRAYVEAKIKNRILYSKSFGSLGCGIPKAIGAAHATGNSVLCIIGDQGFQLNMQELQMIVQEKIPVRIVIVNNRSSGMIRSKQKSKYDGDFIHTTNDSGYSLPDIEAIAKAYGIEYTESADVYPSIAEIIIDEDIDLFPNLPAGNECQDMFPLIDRQKYEILQKM